MKYCVKHKMAKMNIRFQDEFWSSVETLSNEPKPTTTRKKKNQVNDDVDELPIVKEKKTRKRRKKDVPEDGVAKPFYFDAAITHGVDLSYNPYPEEIICENLQKWQKIQFRSENEKGEPVHEYLLCDHRGGYNGELLVSATKLRDYHRKYQLLDGQNGVDLLDLARELRQRTSFLHANAEEKFETSVSLIRDIFVHHINKFTVQPYGIDPPHRLYQTFADRRQYFFQCQNIVRDRKDFSQFVPSVVFREIEMWLCSGTNHTGSLFVKSTDADVAMLLMYLGNEGIERIKHPVLKSAFLMMGDIPVINGKQIAYGYDVGCDAGTRLHKYMEFRLMDLENNTPELAQEYCKCREEEDLIQAEETISYIVENRLRVQTELPFLSYMHKVCGCVDCLIEHEDGTFQIADFKRTPIWNNEPWFMIGEFQQPRRPSLSHQPLGGDIVKYAIQTAIYRKLGMLNGYNMRPTALLLVMHPSLDHMRIVELNLNEKMRVDFDHSQLGGLGMVFGEEEGKCLSPIEYVELAFMYRLEHLREYFNLDKLPQFESE